MGFAPAQSAGKRVFPLSWLAEELRTENAQKPDSSLPLSYVAY